MASSTQHPTTPQAAPQTQYAEQGAQPVLTGADHRKAIAHEYGQFVAVQPIYVGNARAYNPGDPVPASAVERYGYEQNRLVAKATTKAGSAAVEDAASS